jgi:hypothetical protein
VSSRHDPDLLITTWVAEAAGGGAPDYLSEVLTVVERTSQHRWARWVPGAGVSAPDRAPLVRSRALLIAAAALVLLVIGAALAAGAFRKPAFTLQQSITLPGATGVMFVGRSDDALWATVPYGVVRIDPQTGALTHYDVEGGSPDLTGVLEHDGRIYVADYHAGIRAIDAATGTQTGLIPADKAGGLQWQDGLWVGTADRGVVRIDPATGMDTLSFPDAIAYALSPTALWYLATTANGYVAVEADPASGVERRRVPIPFEVAATITIDPAGNPWLYRRGLTMTSVATIDAASGSVTTPFTLPYDAIGGIGPIADSMWALPAAHTPYGSHLVELSPSGPTGRVEPTLEGLDPDGAIVAFDSVWIPWEGPGTLNRFPVGALAR